MTWQGNMEARHTNSTTLNSTMYMMYMYIVDGSGGKAKLLKVKPVELTCTM